MPVITCSQSNDFSKVDNYVSSLKNEKDIPISDLTKKLTSPFSSDLLKTRAVFYWIASNIEYDSNDIGSGSSTSYPSVREIINDTYKFRKGDCRGYSQLFRHMLELSGIKSIVITGYSRTDLKNCFSRKPDHAWNSAKIDNQWYLFDVTWAGNSINEINDFWFKTDPDTFILNHYPEYQPYTYTERKYSLDDFYSFPIYTTLFYDLKFSNELSKKGHFIAVNDTVTIHIKPDFECLLMAKFYDVDKKEWLPDSAGEYKSIAGIINVNIPKKGNFVLRLGAIKKEGDSFVVYKELVFYTIENN